MPRVFYNDFVWLCLVTKALRHSTKLTIGGWACGSLMVFERGNEGTFLKTKSWTEELTATLDAMRSFWSRSDWT